MNKELQNSIYEIQKSCKSKAKKPIDEVLKAYKRSLEQVQNEIGKIALKYQVDGVLNISSQQRYNVLKSLEKQLAEQYKTLGNTNIDKLSDALMDIWDEAYYKTAFTIDKGISGVMDFSILRPEFVEAAINTPIDDITFSDRIWKNQQKLVSRVKHDVEQALIQGKSPEKLARQIKKDFGVSAYEAKRLISNEVARAVNMAQDEIYNHSDVVEKVMFDATLDSKTSEICQNLDGQYFPKDDHPSIPDGTHVSCRSCIIPVVSGWKPKKKLENIKDPETGKKKTIDYSNYDQWRKSKGL